MGRLRLKAASMVMAAALAFMPVAGYFNPAVVYAEDGDVTVKVNSITVEGAVEGHSYKVCQVFTGTAGETTDGDGNLKMVDTEGAEIDGWNENADTGVISSNIVNYTGATLPSTGGIGTVVFYVTGRILMLAAGVVAVSRKKAKGSQE